MQQCSRVGIGPHKKLQSGSRLNILILAEPESTLISQFLSFLVENVFATRYTHELFYPTYSYMFADV